MKHLKALTINELIQELLRYKLLHGGDTRCFVELKAEIFFLTKKNLIFNEEHKSLNIRSIR